MKAFNLKRFVKIGLCGFATALLLSNWVGVFAKNMSTDSYRSLPFPNNLKHYEVEIFRLVDASHSTDPKTKISYYDPQFAKLFETVVKNFSGLDKRLKQKILSGPAPQGKYIEIGNSPYIFYTICQAHWCNVTNLHILYQPGKQRIAGRLLYECGIHEFGDVSKEEMQVINQISPTNVDDEDCKFVKGKK